MSTQPAENSLLGFGSASPATLPPIGAPAGAAGFAASAEILTAASKASKELNALASKVLRDPVLLRQLSDRVYQLFLEDLRNQEERTHSYRGKS